MNRRHPIPTPLAFLLAMAVAPMFADSATPGIQGRDEQPECGDVAERVGFEPTEGCPSPVFKTGALNRSAISP